MHSLCGEPAGRNGVVRAAFPALHEFRRTPIVTSEAVLIGHSEQRVARASGGLFSALPVPREYSEHGTVRRR